MTTLAALVAAAPDPGHGRPTRIVHGAGVWRVVVELADPGAGSGVEWFDITGYVAGWSNQRGADQYAGRYRASVVDMDLWAGDDQLAPWNTDTSAIFGVHVPLGPGLILRAGFIRVVDDTVVDWLPRFTNRVERYGDAAYGKGRARRFPIVARDLITALVGVPIPASSSENWSERVDYILTQAEWAFGSTVYGATFDTGVDVLTVPARPAASSALSELAVTCDPAGLCYYTDRTGRLIIRPTVWDTFHTDAFTAGADGTPLPAAGPVMFTYLAGEDDGLAEWAAYAADGNNPFGFDKTEDAIVNHVVIAAPGGTYDTDDPVSIQRYDRKTFQATWIANNDQVAQDLLEYRADAVVEAHPLDTSIELQGFMPGPAQLDYLGYVSILHKNTVEGPTAFGNGWVRQYTERCAPRREDDTTWELSIVVDIDNVVDETMVLLPVEDLTLLDVTDVSAEFSWTNPTQVITPTNTQIRVLNPASLWATVAYPILGVDWGALEPSTAYQFEVRLIRVVDGLITHYSPSRAVGFTTDPTTVPDIVDVGDDGDTDVDFPPPGDACTSPTVEWELQESADTTSWSTVLDGEILTAPWEVTIPDFAYDGTKFYRIRSREVCAGVPGAWVYSLLYTGHCTDPPALTGAPFDDPDLRFYFPAICPPDTLVEAISEFPATKGYAYADFVTDGAGNVVLVSDEEGIVAYGPNQDMEFTPTLDGLVGDATAACKLLVTTQPDAPVVLFSAAGLRLHAVANGANWSVNGEIVNAGGGVTSLVGVTPLNFGEWYDVAITHDTVGGDVILYVNGGDEDTVAGLDNNRHNPGAWGVGIPAGSLITNCAVWARVLDASELPGYVAAPGPTVTINQGASQADPATASPIIFDVVFSEAVTGFATGDVTLSGTAGATTATVSGTGPSYTVTVTGMTGSGTVIATIAAAVCTSTATSVANDASTSTDNTVTYNASPIPTSDLWAWYDADDAGTITASGSDLTAWADKSVTNGGGTLVPGTATSPKTGTRTLNSNNVIDFNGSTMSLGHFGPTLPMTAFTMFIVCAGDTDHSDNRRIVSFSQGSSSGWNTVNGFEVDDGSTTTWFQFASNFGTNGAISLSGSGATPANIYTVRKQGTGTNQTTIWRGQGTASATQTNNSNGTSGSLHVGAGHNAGEAYDGLNFDGIIAEIIIYSAALSDGDRNTVWSYLAGKWGV